MKLDDVPRFVYLLGAYFHQDWEEVSGPSWTDVVDDVVASEAATVSGEVVRDLTLVLAAVDDDVELSRMINETGDYVVTERDARRWLTAVRDRIAASL